MTKKTMIGDIEAFRGAVINKIDPRGLTMRFAPLADPLVASDSERVATFVFSDNSVDRYGDTIDARGWVLDSFLANPVALFGHDSGSVENVIGKARNVRVQGDRLIGEIEFMEASVNPAAEAVYQMVKGGYLNAVSVGFMPLDWALAKDKSRQGGIDFKKQELMEISIVPIPANANALVQARAAGIDVDRLKLIEGAKSAPKIVRRGLYEVSFLAEILSALDCLEDMVEWEAEIEGDGSGVPDRLVAALNLLGQILIDMTAEEVAELLADEDGEAPLLSDDPITMAALQPAQKALVALVRMARVSAAAASAFAPSRKAAATPIVQRAGKVISQANEKKLRDAHGMITQGCDMIIGVVGEPDDDVITDEPDDSKAVKAAADAAIKAEADLVAQRQRRARAKARKAKLRIANAS